MQRLISRLFCQTSISTYYPHLTMRSSGRIPFFGQVQLFDDIESLPDQLPINEPFILLMDFSFALQQSKQLQQLYVKYTNCYTLILRAPDMIKTSDLLMLGRLKGLFSQREETETVLKGVNQVVKGDLCLPDSVTHQLLDYYQSIVIRHGSPHQFNLTQRETEVLCLLKEGVSNNYLADELYISEHTVKSHLYKIFKKLNIKNRNQATEWAHKFLP